MTNTRSNVFTMGSDWADPILWYARGVGEMKKRPLGDPTSWNFYAAMHGVMRWVWDFYGFTNPTDADPSPTLRSTYWNQCQHQSWYFLPWHRGYLLALENQIRAEIESLGGPHESWTLPYWNYFGTDQNFLPPAFQTPVWPDGNSDNPLFVPQRWGQLSTSTPFDVSSATNLDAMSDPVFTGLAAGGNVGFGGPQTGFNWNGGSSGELEMNPHNIIHGLVGGENQALQFPPGPPMQGRNQFGVMSTPRTAALDPIFYLHHCNIDRLWESWNTASAGSPSADPTDWRNPVVSQWLNGPASIGERKFVMPKPDGTEWVYTPQEMESISALGYAYDDLTPGATVVPLISMAVRMTRLGFAAAAIEAAGAERMTASSKTEMIGASDDSLTLAGSGAHRTLVRTSREARMRVTDSLLGSRALPDRVFLNLENITGLADATIFQVYVGLPEGTEPARNKEFLAGSVSLFGVSGASDPDGAHAGNGISATLEITRIVDALHLSGNFDVDALSVQIVPFSEVSERDNVTIGRISLYRQFE